MAAAKRREPDPPSQLRALAKQLGGELARGYAFRGDERYFQERGVELVTRAAQAAGLELARHDKADPEFQLARLLDDLGASPLFSKGRCVVVRNADTLLAKVGKSDSPFVRGAVAFLGRPGGVLVVTGGAGALRADGALCKAIVAGGGPLVGCRKLWDSPPPWNPDPLQTELVQWVVARAREERVRLAPHQAAYLAAAIGNDLAGIDGQLEKLRHGGAEQLADLVGWESGGSPWAAADELVSGDLPRALAALEALFRAGFSGRDGRREIDPAALANMLLAALRSKLRQQLAGARALARGASPDEAAAAAGVPRNPKALASFKELVGRRSPARWRALYEELGELDRRTRTGATVDASDFARLAVRWRVDPGRAPARGAR